VSRHSAPSVGYVSRQFGLSRSSMLCPPGRKAQRRALHLRGSLTPGEPSCRCAVTPSASETGFAALARANYGSPSSLPSRRAKPALPRGWDRPAVLGACAGAESDGGRGRDKAEAFVQPVVQSHRLMAPGAASAVRSRWRSWERGWGKNGAVFDPIPLRVTHFSL